MPKGPRIAAIVAVLAGLPCAAQAQLDPMANCLSPQAQDELMRRMQQVMLEMAGEVATSTMTLRTVKQAHAGSADALAKCEVAQRECDAERATLATASARLAEVTAERERQTRERPAKVAARIQAIRAEYPFCPDIPR